MTQKKTSLKDLGIKPRDIERLENYLICVPHCEEHKHESTMLDIEGRTKEAEELEESWKSCRKCKAIRDDWWRGAWKVQSRLFDL